MKRAFAIILLLGSTLIAHAQLNFQALNPDTYWGLDRLEIQNGSLLTGLHQTVKPFRRSEILHFIDTTRTQGTKRDAYYQRYFQADSPEGSPVDSAAFQSRKPFFIKRLYQNPSDFYRVQTTGFDLHLNPVLYWSLGYERDRTGNVPFINSRGVEVRGTIDDRIGFYAFVAENQASLQQYALDRAYAFPSKYPDPVVAQEGFAKPFKQDAGVDFLSGRGYVHLKATRHLDFQFGHDKHFVGNGYRSLVLSDQAASYTFLRYNLNVWRIHYVGMVGELNAGFGPQPNGTFPDERYNKKFIAFHRLGINVTKFLNIGLFESIISGRQDTLTQARFEWSYLNPVIFYRSIEQHNGSRDNALLGMDYKVNFLKRFSWYGQVVLDEFVLNEIKSGEGWWANKYAIQTGLKYINVAGIDNLDLQGEWNLVRPFTYTHADNYRNYTHYNQALAHPLGANFNEWIGILNYRPLDRLNISMKAFLYTFGDDTSNVNINPSDNNGGNIFKSYNAVAGANTYGNEIGQGLNTRVIMLTLTPSYMVKHNLWVDLYVQYRQQESDLANRNLNTVFTSLALRWNISQRLQEY